MNMQKFYLYCNRENENVKGTLFVDENSGRPAYDYIDYYWYIDIFCPIAKLGEVIANALRSDDTKWMRSISMPIDDSNRYMFEIEDSYNTPFMDDDGGRHIVEFCFYDHEGNRALSPIELIFSYDTDSGFIWNKNSGIDVGTIIDRHFSSFFTLATKMKLALNLKPEKIHTTDKINIYYYDGSSHGRKYLYGRNFIMQENDPKVQDYCEYSTKVTCKRKNFTRSLTNILSKYGSDKINYCYYSRTSKGIQTIEYEFSSFDKSSFQLMRLRTERGMNLTFCFYDEDFKKKVMRYMLKICSDYIEDDIRSKAWQKALKNEYPNMIILPDNKDGTLNIIGVPEKLSLKAMESITDAYFKALDEEKETKND